MAMDRGALLVTGGLFAIVVVVTGTVVVVEGTTGVVVVGVTDVDGIRLTEVAVRDVVATCATLVVLRVAVTRVRRCAWALGVVTTVELVVTVLEILTVDVVKFVEGDTELAITGIAVALSTMPTTRNPSDPMTTERRGARVEGRVESIRFFCPCVKFNMLQLSETHSKMPPTTAQHPLNSEVHVATLRRERCQ